MDGLGKGLGIAALCFAIIGAFMPVVGLYVGWIALLLASAAALFGQRGLAVATAIISAVVFVFLTPSLWMTQGLTMLGNEFARAEGRPTVVNPFLIVSLVALATPIVSVFLNASGRVSLGGRSARVSAQ